MGLFSAFIGSYEHFFGRLRKKKLRIAEKPYYVLKRRKTLIGKCINMDMSDAQKICITYSNGERGVRFYIFLCLFIPFSSLLRVKELGIRSYAKPSRIL